MALFQVSEIKKSEKGNLIASLVKQGVKGFLARPKLYRVWVGDDISVNDTLEASDEDFVPSELEGPNGLVTIHWYDPK